MTFFAASSKTAIQNEAPPKSAALSHTQHESTGKANAMSPPSKSPQKPKNHTEKTADSHSRSPTSTSITSNNGGGRVMSPVKKSPISKTAAKVPKAVKEEMANCGSPSKSSPSPRKTSKSSVSTTVSHEKAAFADSNSPSTPSRKPSVPKSGSPPNELKPNSLPRQKSPDGKLSTPVANLNTTPQSSRKPFWAYNAREGPRNLGGKPIPKGNPTCLKGLNFLITGILDSIERDDARDLIERCGGKVLKTLGKKTDYLVVGREPGESKLAKAETLNTKQLDEDGLFDLIRKLAHEDSAVSEEQSQPSIAHSPSPRNKPSVTKSPGKKEAMPHDPLIHSSLTGKPVLTNSHSVRQPHAQVTPGSEPLTDFGETLWVEKYKPTLRRSLIGQNGPCSPANRLFNWLSDWHQHFASGAKARAYSSAPPWASGSGDDGKWARAALLSGPPGIGKTSSVVVVCKELDFAVCELNASDSRSKKTLQGSISQSVQTANLASMATVAGSCLSTKRHVLVMDEVDGMAGNEDRGGMQELINMIKSSRIPVICMCNDRQSPKIRSLANYCYDLRFQRPRIEQIKAALMSIACKEGVSVSPGLLNNIIESSNQDIRQAVNSLQMYAAGHSTDESMTDRLKDVRLNAFEAIRKVFASDSSGSSSVNDSLDLFFQDYSLMPLFVEENYLSVRHRTGEYTQKQHLQLLAQASSDIATGDIVSNSIRNAGTGSWSLLPVQGIFSLVRPGRMLHGVLPGGPGGGVNFPGWFGKNSNQQRMRRVSGELAQHLVLTTRGGSSNVRSLVMDYLPILADRLTSPLKEGDTGTVLNALLHYNLLREDFDSILELTTWSNRPNRMLGIDSKVKSSLTRSLNKTSHLLPYATVAPVKGKSKRSSEPDDLSLGLGSLEDDDDGGDHGVLDASHSEEEEETADAMIISHMKRKASAAPADSIKPAKKSKPKAESASGRGRGRGKLKQ